MYPFKVLNHEDIKAILDMKNVIDIVEKAYVLKENKEASLFPMVFHEFEPGKADMDIKSGELSGAGIFGLKLVSWFGDNPSKNLPAVVGTVLVLDSRTGLPIGILSGEYMTMMRTGAAGGIGAKYLARKDSEELLMVGSGHVAAYQILAVLMTMNHIKRVRVYNAHSFDRAGQFCADIKGKLKELLAQTKEQNPEVYEEMLQKIEIEYTPVNDIETATRNADIIITATPARQPIILKEWVMPGTHFSCVGADMAGKQEIDENILTDARIFVDDHEQSVTVGEFETAFKKGIIAKDSIISEIGGVITNQAPGRISPEDITVFDSTGISLQDLLTASYVLEQAEEKQIGMSTKL
ncbi:MAG: ornithine cyclodeaminase family protein [Bacillaceae bacterium]|uniref:ornithine cyclodeaminase family protein n=1 Tax=Bacillus safensis TaxID=561879 RepID=UPI001D17ED30|nr:ornithine cyclodeaminase family protein [Bacillus safensis]MBW4848812.1 ornithine cyclodeaminase family protein [Bacillaceae bacterium]MBW4851187.1 ornithine cyclodeaminase family protein [Bacillaceae bacterium]MBW4857028.1 ornithine cyclodeaminase family protein [Bacillaceae bacterium]